MGRAARAGDRQITVMDLAGADIPYIALNDQPLYLALGEELSRAVRPAQQLRVPIYASFLTGTRAFGERLTLRSELYGWDALGRKETYSRSSRAVPYRPWLSGALEPLAVTMPNEASVAVLAVRLEDATGRVLHRDFTTFVVEAEAAQEVQLEDGRRARLVQIDPARFDSASWSQKQWNVLDGLKVNGAGSGFFEYGAVAGKPRAGPGVIGVAGRGGLVQAALR